MNGELSFQNIPVQHVSVILFAVHLYQLAHQTGIFAWLMTAQVMTKTAMQINFLKDSSGVSLSGTHYQ